MRLSQLRQHVAAELAGEAVPNLSISGNTFTLLFEGNKKIVSQIDGEGKIYVDVIFADANTTKSRMFWHKKFSQKEDEQVAPDCWSDDNVTPNMQSTSKQSDFCAQCPHNVWGTAIGDEGSGKGKRCREIWKTAVVVPAFSPEALFQLRIPPASLKHWNAYMSQFAEIEVEGREGDAGDVVTRVYFEPEKQGIINFEGVAYVTSDQRAYVVHVQEENTAANLIGLAAGTPQLAAPTPKAQISAPAKQIEKPKAAPVEEVDEEAELMKQIMEVKAKKAAEQKQASQQAAQAAQPKPAGLPKAATTAQPKAAAPASKAGLGALPKGAVALSPGMRTKTGEVIPPNGGAGISRYAAAMAKADAQEAEIVPEVQQNQPIVKKARPVETPEGIPSTNLPDELNNLLAGIMGTK